MPANGSLTGMREEIRAMSEGDVVVRALLMPKPDPAKMREFNKQGHTLISKLREETGFKLTLEPADVVACDGVVRCLVVTRG